MKLHHHLILLFGSMILLSTCAKAGDWVSEEGVYVKYSINTDKEIKRRG